MQGKNFARQGVNQPIIARTINEPITAIERLSRVRVGSGLSSEDVAGIPLYRNRGVPIARIAKTGGGGIAAFNAGTLTPGSASVAVYRFNGTIIADASWSVTAFNSSTTAVGANKWIQMKLIDGFYFVDVESC